MVESKPAALKAPTYSQCKDFEPGFRVWANLRVGEIKILNERTNFDGEVSRIADVLVGDETGSINFFAKEDSLKLIEVGKVYSFRNAHAAVAKEHMRIEVDKWAKLVAAESSVKVGEINKRNNLSDEEYEKIPPENTGKSGRGRRGGRRN